MYLCRWWCGADRMNRNTNLWRWVIFIQICAVVFVKIVNCWTVEFRIVHILLHYCYLFTNVNAIYRFGGIFRCCLWWMARHYGCIYWHGRYYVAVRTVQLCRRHGAIRRRIHALVCPADGNSSTGRHWRNASKYSRLVFVWSMDEAYRSTKVTKKLSFFFFFCFHTYTDRLSMSGYDGIDAGGQQYDHQWFGRRMPLPARHRTESRNQSLP